MNGILILMGPIEVIILFYSRNVGDVILLIG